MAVNTYIEGSLVRTEAAFTSSGVAVDPDSVMFSLRLPSGVTTTAMYGSAAAVVKASTGNYRYDVDCRSTVGYFYYRWEGWGTWQAATEGQFRIEDSQVFPG